MLRANVPKVVALMGKAQRSLDVGGWHKPLNAATHVLDVSPYETRCRLAATDPRNAERFTRDTWIRMDICGRTPWPFPDRYFDFACCSHVLEDIRDPIWVVSELSRVAQAGYIETPTPASEILAGHWPFRPAVIGQLHHRWFVEFPSNDQIVFRMKPHDLLSTGLCVSYWDPFYRRDSDRLSHGIFWEKTISATEAIFDLHAAIGQYLPRARSLIHFDPLDRILSKFKPAPAKSYTPEQTAHLPYS